MQSLSVAVHFALLDVMDIGVPSAQVIVMDIGVPLPIWP